MEQDDKVFAAALSLSPVGSTGGSGRASAPQDDARTARDDNSARSNTNEAPSEDPADDSDRSQDEEVEPKGSSKAPKRANNVRRIRIERMLSKAELARRANLSVLTIDRVERGYGCRMDTKRKILEALGLSLADRVRVFGEEE